MSVVERETAPCGPVTHEEWRARTLEAAALEIEVRGWTQRTLERDGKVCALGAIVAACGFEPSVPWFAEYPAVFNLSGYGANQCLTAWNDRPGRTAGEVTFLLRWRAEEIRDGL